MLCMMLMYTTAHHRIRQQSFETFWYTHHLFVPFMLALYTHATGCFVRDTVHPYSPFAGKEFWNHCLGYEGWRWELVGGGLYLFERLYREIRARRDTVITKVIRHPYGTSTRSLSQPHLTIDRRNGNPIPQTKHEIQSRPMALHPSPRSLQLPMAPLHHNILSLRPLHQRPRPPSRRLHPFSRRRTRLRTRASQRPRRSRSIRHVRSCAPERPENAHSPRRRSLRCSSRRRLR